MSAPHLPASARRALRALAPGLCAAALLSGCIIETGDERDLPTPVVEPPAADALLKIRELEVTGVTDASEFLELEVHLLDAATNTFLGCSGNLQGLLGVDLSDRRYVVDAHFVKPGGVVGYPNPRDEWLTYADVRGKRLKFVVLEDDLVACPSPQNPEDDVVGVSAPVAADLLGDPAPVAMASGQVTRLVIGTK
jgi:hypothetical protein